MRWETSHSKGVSGSSCDDNKRVECKPASLYLKVATLFFYIHFTSFLLDTSRKNDSTRGQKKILACVSKLKITKRENSGKIIRISEKNNIAERSLN